MDELDHDDQDLGSLDACQQLIAAGIILKTKRSWYLWNDGKWHEEDTGTWSTKREDATSLNSRGVERVASLF